MIPNFIKSSKHILGSFLSLPAYGRVGQGQHFFLAAHFAKRNAKFGGGESEGRAGIHFPFTPFSARPSGLVSAAPQARHQSEFRSKKVRASFSNCDQ